MAPTAAVILVAVTLATAARGGPLEEPRSSGATASAKDCSRWSIDGLHLDMTLGQIESEHPEGKFRRNRLMLDDRGRSWYGWTVRRSKGLRNQVLPENRHDPGSRLRSILVTVERGRNVADLILALEERWGPPTVVHDRSRYRLPGYVTAQWVTFWEDRGCDVRASVIDVQRERTLPPAQPGVDELGVHLPGVRDTDLMLRLDRLSTAGPPGTDVGERPRSP